MSEMTLTIFRWNHPGEVLSSTLPLPAGKEQPAKPQLPHSMTKFIKVDRLDNEASCPKRQCVSVVLIGLGVREHNRRNPACTLFGKNPAEYLETGDFR